MIAMMMKTSEDGVGDGDGGEFDKVLFFVRERIPSIWQKVIVIFLLIHLLFVFFCIFCLIIIIVIEVLIETWKVSAVSSLEMLWYKKEYVQGKHVVKIDLKW